MVTRALVCLHPSQPENCIFSSGGHLVQKIYYKRYTSASGQRDVQKIQIIARISYFLNSYCFGGKKVICFYCLLCDWNGAGKLSSLKFSDFVCSCSWFALPTFAF